MKLFRSVLIITLLVCLRPFATLAQTDEETTAVLITEVVYNPPGEDSEEEWLEIANLGTTAVALTDYQIGDEETQGGSEGMVRFPDGTQIEPGQALVVAQTAVAFQRRYGFNPAFELHDTDPAVPDMLPALLWASGDLALNNDGDEVLLVWATAVRDAIAYGQSTYFQPAILGVLPGQSIERVPANCDTDTAAGWLPRETPTPGQITLTGDCPMLAPAPTVETLPIGQIQGAGDVSPYVNQTVTLRGVVTGVYEDRNTQGATYYTLFVQDLPGATDGDPATSDGLAIFTGRQRPSVQLGDVVVVTGQVTEFFGFTELDDGRLTIHVEAQGQPLPDPIPLNPPAANDTLAAYYEPLEGMRVSIPGAARVVGPTFSGCGLAVVGEGGEGDGRFIRQRLSDPIGQIVPVLHISDVQCDGFPNVKSGDTIQGLVGPLIYHFDQFKLVQQEPDALVITAGPLPTPPAAPIAAAHQFSVATFNLENYFDAADDTGDAAEPKPDPAEIGLKQAKLVYAIGHSLGCPTLVGVQEVETAALLDALAQELAAPCGFVYTVTHRDSADERGIDVALLSDPTRVQVQAATLRQTCTGLDAGVVDNTAVCPANQFPLFSRPPLQADLSVEGTAVTVYVNHLKSKRGGELETEDRRLAQAAHLNALAAEQLAANPEARLIVLGDMNDYELSAPMLALTEDGRLHNVLAHIPLPERYSYVYAGASQLIDGLLVTSPLAGALVTTTILHLNADYPDSLARDLSPAALPFKSTDHDLPLAIFALSGAPEPAPTPMTTPAEASSRGWLGWTVGLMVGGVGTAVLLVILVARRRQPG